MAKKTREPAIPFDEAVQRLAGWGYIDPETRVRDITPARFRDAVRRYQEFNGLEPDGWLGPVTAHLIDNPLRCGLPDLMLDARAAWPMKRVSFHSRLRLGLQDAGAVFARAAQQWNAVCGIELFAVGSTACNILADEGAGRADGLDDRGGTLAWSQLPHGSPNQRIQQKYDRAEAWTDAMLLAVACHELGHAIGLPHLAAGNLLQPYYSASITAPQRGDIAEVVARYGKPSPAPAPSPAPGGAASAVSVSVDSEKRVVVSAVIDGEQWGAEGSLKRSAAIRRGNPRAGRLG